jgi:ribose/xylose/arabinose/galactoside ABC-type transport system permease subunit
MNARIKALWKTRELSTLCVLALEIAFFTWYLWPEAGRAHPFFNLDNGVLVLKYSSLYGIAAIGAAMVIISGGVDLAPGAVMALAGVVTGHFFAIQGHPLPLAVTAGILVGLLSGVLSAILVVLVKLPPFIATLGVMGIARGIAFIITEGRFFDLSSRLPPGWKPFGLPPDWLAPIVLVGLAAVFQYLTRRFQWGRALFAIGGNETAALFSGIRVGKVKASVYIVAAVLASL